MTPLEAWNRVRHLVLYESIEFAVFVLGACCVMWGTIGLLHPVDLQWYANGFALEFAPWLWGVNHIGFGLSLMWLAINKLPPGPSLMIGMYGVWVFTWVMMGRPNSSMSSGVTLNFVLVFVSGLIIQRSGRKK